MRFFLIPALLLALCGPCSAAQRIDIAPRYAQALRAFNPRLSGAGSVALARRVIVEADGAGLDARLVVALVAIESSWHPSAVSPAGAVGLGQLMPGTADHLGVDPRDPNDNLHGTITHLAYLLRTYARYDGAQKFVLALSAYNAGEGAVARYGGMPPYAETQNYVRDVVALWRRLAGA